MFLHSGEEVVNAPTGLENTGVEQTTFTERSSDSGLVSHRDQRPALLVSSTSWTGQCFFVITYLDCAVKNLVMLTWLVKKKTCYRKYAVSLHNNKHLFCWLLELINSFWSDKSWLLMSYFSNMVWIRVWMGQSYPNYYLLLVAITFYLYSCEWDISWF